MHLESIYYAEATFVIDITKDFRSMRMPYPLLSNIEYFILLLQLKMELLIALF